VSTLIHKRVIECRNGEYPKAVCQVRSGWVVLGDVQFLPGYSLLLPDPVVANLNELTGEARSCFLEDMTLLGDAVLELTNAVRINYEILGNVEPALHAHVFPRFDDEPEDLKLKPVWFYDWKAAPEFDTNRDTPFMDKLRDKLIALGIAQSDSVE